ncbi:MAG TPA: 3-oxoacyl-ACP reductase FabG [Actinomycetota bacterium]|nr:3-oxoacyl-ACP reductase FabG [Actinomycetota bacterium]
MTRAALVTGASRGIGRAVALSLGESGFSVACGYLNDDASAKETVDMVEGAGGTAAAFRVDVTEAAEIEELFRQVREWVGPPLVLVNNAGVSKDGLALTYSPDDLDRTLDTNLRGAFLCARAALPGMLRARQGRIVNIASAVALRGNPGQTAYAASKAGLVGFTRSLAREVGRKGITVNALCPGLIETDIAEAMTPAQRDALVASTPAGRLGNSSEVAAAVTFLASDAASYVNGAVLTVDGGLTA